MRERGLWQHLANDGREEALSHARSGYWLPLAEVRELGDVSRWVEHVGVTSWATKQDTIDLTILLLEHIENILSKREQALTNQRGRDKEFYVAAAAAAAKAAAAAGARAGSSPTNVEFGMQWGKWAFTNHPNSGPSIIYDSHYQVALTRVQTPQDIGDWVAHFAHKDSLSAQDIADAASAFITCFVGQLPQRKHSP